MLTTATPLSLDLTKTTYELVLHDKKSLNKVVRPLNPLVEVPVLQTENGAICDSTAILRYIARSTKQLYGTNTEERARVDSVIEFIQVEMIPKIHPVLLAVAGQLKQK